MKIRSIHISEFGGLRDFSLDLSDSLNIIMGDNESGKSTVLLFITYMLYGLAKKGAKAPVDKARSISWEGSKAEGYIDVELEGTLYRITRALKGKTSVSNFSVFELESGKTVDCASPADLFLSGVSRETFESCCLCGQLRTAGIHGAEVSETLSNLSLGADESVNATEVIENVRKARKEYKHERGKGGLIDDVSDEIDKLSEKKLLTENRLHKLASDKAELERKIVEHESAAKRLAEAERARENREALRSLGRFDEQRRLKKELESAESELSALRTVSGFGDSEPTAIGLGELKHLLREYEKKNSHLDILTSSPAPEPSRIDEKAKTVAERIKANGGKEAYLERISAEKKKSRAKKLLAIVLAAFAAISFCLSVLSLLFIGLGAILAIAAIVCLLTMPKNTESAEYLEFCFAQLELYTAEKEQRERAEAACVTAKADLEATEAVIREKLKQYNRSEYVTASEALEALIGDVARYLEAQDAANQKISVRRELCLRAEKELAGLDEAALRASLPEGVSPLLLDNDKVDDEYRAALADEKRLTSEITDLRIRTESSGVSEQTLYEIESELSELQKKKNEYTERYEIYDLALHSLETARDNLQRAFAPEVRRKASELISRISAGKYSNVFLSQKLEVSLESGNLPRAAEHLSAGTADIVYIALRLSLIESIFSGKAPLFLDETLSQVDDKRAGEVLRLIYDFTERGNQCLFFTCHKRETTLCAENGIAHNLIDLNGNR